MPRHWGGECGYGVGVLWMKRPGRKWRVLAQDSTGVRHELQDVAEFDELCVDHWIHLERMDHRDWWMQLGSLYVWITVRANGNVDVAIRGGEYPVPGRVTVEGVE